MSPWTIFVEYGIKHSFVSSQPGTADPTALTTSITGSGSTIAIDSGCSITGTGCSITGSGTGVGSGGGDAIESSKTQFSYSIGNDGLEVWYMISEESSTWAKPSTCPNSWIRVSFTVFWVYDSQIPLQNESPNWIWILE